MTRSMIRNITNRQITEQTLQNRTFPKLLPKFGVKHILSMLLTSIFLLVPMILALVGSDLFNNIQFYPVRDVIHGLYSSIVSPKVDSEIDYVKHIPIKVKKNGFLKRKTSGFELSYFEDPINLDPWGVAQKYDDSKFDNSVIRAFDGVSTDEPKKEIVQEALATLNLAVEFRDNGKTNKARRLFDHAMNLAPKHPDILNEFGLFMEKTNEIVLAEKMFTKALIYSPWHKSAKENRARTQPIVEDIDYRMLSAIDKKHEYFLGISTNNPALRRAMKEAYFQHIYHTVAIEGNTMTYAETRSVLETKMAVGGKSVLEHNEILGMDAALRLINQSLIGRVGALSIDDIKQIHLRVMGAVDPIEAGKFRTTQVFVGSFTPPPPSDLSKEMDEFIEWINNHNTLQIHPVELAALCHYKFVYIHPFIDGNGRTARLLMNLILMQAGFPPVIIKIDDRLKYYETLATANEGDLRPFIRLIARSTDLTLEGYLNAATIHKQTENEQCRTKEIEQQHRTQINLEHELQ